MQPTAILTKLIARQDLALDEAHALFDALMDNRLEPALMGAILAALAAKGESTPEIVGAALAMRARVSRVRIPDGVTAIDTCGTGGDGRPTLNVSTAAAVVAAAAGATVAKHGNRSNARPSGSAEVLIELGVNLDADVATLERCLRDCRVAFLFAVHLHPAMKYAAPVRRALGIRTIFNLVGPLTNPAGVRRQLLGVSRPEHVDVMLKALRELDAERALVVHGLEGLCDISIAGPTRIGRWDGQTLEITAIEPEIAGVPRGRVEDLYIAGPADSAARIRAVLDGQAGPAADAVVLNAAGALWVAGLAADWQEGAERARDAIASGRARAVLDAWCAASRGGV